MQKVKDHPLLMKGPMVLATLDGIKVKTRRLKGLEDVNENPDLWTFNKTTDNLSWMTHKKYRGRAGAYFQSEKIEPRTITICPQLFPYGRVGDRLWIRETFRYADQIVSGFTREDSYYVQYQADGLVYQILKDVPKYSEYFSKGWSTDSKFGPWRPSIFMPRRASRITLEITSIGIERLQNISDQDAIDEGTAYAGGSFPNLWDSINKRRGYGWNKNPWVWVIGFKNANDIQDDK